MAINWIKIYKVYKGKWIALKADEKTVIASGIRASAVHKKAIAKGYRKPILSYIPAHLTPQIGFT